MESYIDRAQHPPNDDQAYSVNVLKGRTLKLVHKADVQNNSNDLSAHQYIDKMFNDLFVICEVEYANKTHEIKYGGANI